MKNKNFAYVVGADLDKTLLTRLVKGDRVLCEMNGARVYSSYTNPIVSDETWEVVSNDERKLVLRHRSKERPLILPYSKLLNLKDRDPAVFMLTDKKLADGDGRVYVIVQFVSHKIPIDQIHQQFPMVFDAAAVLKEDRKGVLNAIVNKLGEFSYPGWNYMGVCRFALRASIRVPVIDAFRERDWNVISNESDEDILRIMTEMNWMPYLLSQSSLYTESTLAEKPYEIRKIIVPEFPEKH